ncbi:MAG: OmpA family protein [Rhodothermales bacterium]
MPEPHVTEPESVRREKASLQIPTLDGGDGGEAETMEELRQLLLAPEQRELDSLRRRISEIQKRERRLLVQEMGEALPSAIALRAAQDDHLAKALGPTIEATLNESVRKNPQGIVEAIFPIIGPAIRRSVSEALEGVTQSFDQILQHSLSVESLQWRLEAWRTDRPFGEVLMSHTLLYRVEQIFLIDRNTGLPLHRVVAEEVVGPQDSSLFSGMLTAVQDFVQDSLGAKEEETLEALCVGDLTVWVEPGPRAYLAAVIRAVPPPGLRDALNDIIETVHLQFREALATYDGDDAPFETARPLLESGLVAQYKKPQSRAKPILLGLSVLLLIGVLVWGFFTIRDTQRWRDYLTRLDAEPGLVITEADRNGGDWRIRGLRDPLAADPQALLNQAGLGEKDVRARWEPYQALDPVIIAQRARRLLTAPDSVTFRVEDVTLYVAGTAPDGWLEEARQRASFLAGITTYDDAALESESRRRLRTLVAAIEGQRLLFPQGSDRPAPEQEQALAAVAADLAALQETAARLDVRWRLRILGHTSPEGSEAVNQRIARRRAEVIRQALIRQGLPAEQIEIEAEGTATSAAEAPANEAQRRNVTFEMVVEE